MERETRLVSCSLAFNGNSVFCLQGFQPLKQKHSSLSSLTQLALSLVRHLWLKLIKKSHFRDSSLWSGRRGSNSRHPPWQEYRQGFWWVWWYLHNPWNRWYIRESKILLVWCILWVLLNFIRFVRLLWDTINETTCQHIHDIIKLRVVPLTSTHTRI